MNNREEPVNNRIRKKMKKEVRSGLKQSVAVIEAQPTLRNTRGQNPAKPAKKILKRVKGNLLEMKKTMEKEKAVKAHPSKQSKRTTPGDVEKVSTPRYPHIEGGRWAKTTARQSVLKSKLLRAKLSKKK